MTSSNSKISHIQTEATTQTQPKIQQSTAKNKIRRDFKMEELSRTKTRGGTLLKLTLNHSQNLSLSTKLNLFIPDNNNNKNNNNNKLPIIYYLAGLTCNEDTGPQKSGILLQAAVLQIAIVFPDTSPRGAKIENEDDDWDFGSGAGFYLDATHPKWKAHYRMQSFIVDELPKALESLPFPLDFERQSIMGHSMGGHGAVTIYLNQPGRFRSCSALAPILNPTRCRWGIKAFAGPNGHDGYLANGVEEGKRYDATELIAHLDLPAQQDLNILIDYGTEDQFYKDGQLLPQNFVAAFESNPALKSSARVDVQVREQDGYDHSYYFVSSFVLDHLKFHAKFLHG